MGVLVASLAPHPVKEGEHRGVNTLTFSKPITWNELRRSLLLAKVSLDFARRPIALVVIGLEQLAESSEQAEQIVLGAIEMFGRYFVLCGSVPEEVAADLVDTEILILWTFGGALAHLDACQNPKLAIEGSV